VGQRATVRSGKEYQSLVGPRAVTRERPARRRRVAASIAAGLCLLAAGAIPPALAGFDDPTPPGAGASTDRVLVRLSPAARDSDGSEKKLASLVGGRHAGKLRPGVFAVDVARGRGQEAARRLKSEAGVALAEEDVHFNAAERPVKFHKAAVMPNEECYSGCRLSFDGGSTSKVYSQADMVRVGAPDAWAVTKGDPDMLVAVVDTDIDATQPDLVGKVVVGRNFSSDSIPDPDGHGTEVAGLIAAQPDNGIGIAGLGWSTRVLSVRVLDSKGAGLASNIALGIRYAADYPGVRVINLSLQQDATDADKVSTELGDAVTYALSKGVVVVAAAGNQSRIEPSYPASFPGVISVGAADEHDQTASFSPDAAFSNHGTWVDLAAPGVGVLTITPGCDCWVTPNGTSFATPFVSAAAALVLAVKPNMTPAEVKARLDSTADSIPGQGVDVASGRLNVGRAVTQSAVAPLSAPDPTAAPAPATPSPVSGIPAAPATPNPPAGSNPGYWLVASDGGIFSYGSAEFEGSTGAITLNKPIVGMAATPSQNGYWLVASDGGIFAFGDAGFFGSTGGLTLNKPIVGMAATPTGKGYWLVASDGGIFAFGDAGFFGSTGALQLNRPIVAMAVTPSGKGYWMTASDGGIFAFGDSHYYGSTGDVRLNRPITAMAISPSGKGYWLVAADGGVFNFGDASQFGSAAGAATANVVGLAPTDTGNGYWIVAADGSVYPFGAATFLGSLGRSTPNRPIVGLATH
jgi:subtilisin family serine protease